MAQPRNHNNNVVAHTSVDDLTFLMKSKARSLECALPKNAMKHDCNIQQNIVRMSIIYSTSNIYPLGSLIPSKYALKNVITISSDWLMFLSE